MNILVLMKQTLDTEETIIFEDNKVKEDDVKFIINPYDEYAIEEAVTIKEQHGGEVTVLSVGPSRSEEALRTALAMGADKAVLIDNSELPNDEKILAKTISMYAKEKEFDLIIGGYMTVDNGSAQVGPRVAEELGIPHLSAVVKLEINQNKAYLERDVEGNLEIIEVEFPVLLTAQQGLNEPRYPSLPSIMKAKRKPIERLSPEDIGVSAEESVSPFETMSYFTPPPKKAGCIFQGDMKSQVAELAQVLIDQEKIV